MREFDFDGLVLVADLWEEESQGDRGNAGRRDLEQTDRETLDDIVAAAGALGIPVHHYQSPVELAEYADRHPSDIVLSIYGGVGSRSRMAITPAVCEAFGLRFIGPDAYGRVIAQDKEISKRLAVDCGLLTPAWRVVRTEREASIGSRLGLPVVVKPLLEGSSIGISDASLQATTEGARDQSIALLREFGQPVLIEQFVAGREISYTKFEFPEDDLWGLSEVVIEGDQEYFSTRLFHADEKVIRDPRRTVRNIDSMLAAEDKDAIDRFLGIFGRYGYCRVDGRLCDGRFHFIELTPDAWLGRSGQLAMSYTEKGWTYVDVIAAVLASAGPDPRAPRSSG